MTPYTDDPPDSTIASSSSSAVPIRRREQVAAPEYDYSENASPAEIAEVLRARELERASTMGESTTGFGEHDEDDESTNAIFDGPAAFSVPSSMTSMHFHYPGRASFTGRRSSIARSTRPSLHLRPSQDDYFRQDFDAASEQQHHHRPSTSRRSSTRSRVSSQALEDEEEGGDWDRREDVTPPQSPGIFKGIASALGFGTTPRDSHVEEHLGRHRSRSIGSRSRRASSVSSLPSGGSRPSATSRQSSENWGYSSNEEDDDYSERAEEEGYTSSLADDTSLPPQSRPSSPTLPLMPSDVIFGDPTPEGGPMLDFSEAAPCGSRQTIRMLDEDLQIRFTGYETHRLRHALWVAGSVLTVGGLGLVGRWVPKAWVRWCGRERDFARSGKNAWMVVETPYGDLHIVDQQVLDYPYPLSTVFPQAANELPRTMSRTATIASASGSGTATPANGSTSELTPRRGSAKDLVVADLERGQTTWEETLGFLRCLDYRYTRFVFQPGANRWQMIRDWRDPRWTSVKAVTGGLSEPIREQRRLLFGANAIDIEGKSLVGLLMDEVLHPFYVFQIASILLWSLDDYYYYAFAIALISVSSIASTLIETKRTIERMREMSRFSCPVQALVDGEWKEVDSSSLVPGDVFDASDATLAVFPCDAFLLSGDAIVNESMLTGESVPVSKIPVKDDAVRAYAKEDKKGSTEVDANLAKHYLFSGTKIIRVRPGAGERALALVTRTGFNTTKGALVRSMLFPKPMGFKFYRDSMNFIGVLAMIAGFGFMISAVQFIRIGIAWQTILIRALDLITIVVPPALPATLTIGTTFAIDRLRKSGIFCISPNRVNIGGKVNVVCFDKTGTLTEDGLDVLGARTIDRHTERFSELHAEVSDIPARCGANGKTPLLYALATCHALKLIDGEVIGDPLDIKMFEFTGWTLDEGKSSKPAAKSDAKYAERPQTLVQTVVRPPGTDSWRLEDALKSNGKHAHFLELGVIRTFDFVSALRRMSVVVKKLKSSSMEIYVKGAPEIMSEICDPESFPKDYDDMLSYYTRNGFRVIAIAGKSVDNLTWLKAQRMKREQAESDLQFLGFIVFENKLKEGTAPAIHALRTAHLACRMVTGDNVRTAISVARECGLVSHSASVYIPTFAKESSTGPDAEVEWSSVDDERQKLDPGSLKPLIPLHSMGYENTEMEQPDYQLALTGDVFRWMLEFAPLETMHRMLVKGVIFARMSPDEKAELVERLQGLGYTVGFCGDGANDCGALKAADIGISLSEAEASVAAPFTSRIPDISCVLEVIKEGRAALVTSFSCFKYMALYSLIQFTTVTLLYSFASSLGDFQFLYIDLFIIIPIAVAMGRTLPYPKIHPKRPTASLVSKKVLTSIIGQTIINSLIQVLVFVWVRRQPWYTKPDVNDETLETFNYENSALFLVSSFQYILVAAVFSVGPPYRKPIWSNISLVACLVGLSAFSTFVLLAPTRSLALVLDIIDLTLRFRVELLVIVIANVALCFGYERYAERPIARLIGVYKNWLRNRSKARRRMTSGKMYKAIEGAMR